MRLDRGLPQHARDGYPARGEGNAGKSLVSPDAGHGFGSTADVVLCRKSVRRLSEGGQEHPRRHAEEACEGSGETRNIFFLLFLTSNKIKKKLALFVTNKSDPLHPPFRDHPARVGGCTKTTVSRINSGGCTITGDHS